MKSGDIRSSRYSQKGKITVKELEITNLEKLLVYDGIEKLEIYGNNSKSFKRIENKYFSPSLKSTLKYLLISENKRLENIDENLLEGMVNLEELVIQNNPKLTEIPDNFFNYDLPNLKTVDIRYNENMRKLDLVFGNLEKLKKFDFNRSLKGKLVNFPERLIRKPTLPEIIQDLYETEEGFDCEEAMLKYLLEHHRFFPDKDITEEYIKKCVQDFF